jgi:hypothetical protein
VSNQTPNPSPNIHPGYLEGDSPAGWDPPQAALDLPSAIAPSELTAFDDNDLSDIHGYIAGAEAAARWILRAMIFGVGIAVGIAIATHH